MHGVIYDIPHRFIASSKWDQFIHLGNKVSREILQFLNQQWCRVKNSTPKRANLTIISVKALTGSQSFHLFSVWNQFVLLRYRFSEFWCKLKTAILVTLNYFPRITQAMCINKLGFNRRTDSLTVLPHLIFTGPASFYRRLFAKYKSEMETRDKDHIKCDQQHALLGALIESNVLQLPLMLVSLAKMQGHIFLRSRQLEKSFPWHAYHF